MHVTLKTLIYWDQMLINLLHSLNLTCLLITGSTKYKTKVADGSRFRAGVDFSFSPVKMTNFPGGRSRQPSHDDRTTWEWCCVFPASCCQYSKGYLWGNMFDSVTPLYNRLPDRVTHLHLEKQSADHVTSFSQSEGDFMGDVNLVNLSKCPESLSFPSWTLIYMKKSIRITADSVLNCGVFGLCFVRSVCI